MKNPVFTRINSLGLNEVNHVEISWQKVDLIDWELRFFFNFAINSAVN